MIEIDVTKAELAAGSLTPENLCTAIEAIREEGFVVLKDVVDLDHISTVRDRMLADVEKILSRPDAPFNWIKGNIQQDPPPIAPYLFRDILVNEHVIQVTHAILGNGLYNSFYSGNTSLPRGDRQPVHPDCGHLWPNMQVPHPPVNIVVNIPLVDMDEHNGSTEIWPGTHKDTSVAYGDDIKVLEEDLAKWRSIAPPIQPSVRAGSVILRDMRLWHAGMPNHSNIPRPLIAMIHTVGWWPHSNEVVFAREAEEILTHPILRTRARFVDASIDYTAHNAAYDYSPDK